MNCLDMTQFIEAKSDQLNADDLIGGPRTITITRVTQGNSPEQPVNVYFEGDDGKPFRPCKSMRRVMVAVWGADAKNYVGRSMTLYRDPKVKFGGMEVGGLRISHMTHIDDARTLALQVTKGKKAGYRVEPLQDTPTKANPAQKWSSTFIETVGNTDTIDDLDALAKKHAGRLDELHDKHAGLWEQCNNAIARRRDELSPDTGRDTLDDIPARPAGYGNGLVPA